MNISEAYQLAKAYALGRAVGETAANADEKFLFTSYLMARQVTLIKIMDDVVVQWPTGVADLEWMEDKDLAIIAAMLDGEREALIDQMKGLSVIVYGGPPIIHKLIPEKK